MPKTPSSQDPRALLENIIGLQKLPPAILITCPDNIRRTRAVDYFLKAKNLNINYQFDSKEFSLESIRSRLLNRSLFDPVPVCLLKNFDQINAENQKRLTDFLDSSNSGNKFDGIIIITSKPFPSNSIFKKYFSSKSWLVEFTELKNFDLKRWISKELKSIGVTQFTELEIDRIMQIGSNSPDEISNVIQQLALYVDGDKVTIADLTELFTIAGETEEFALLTSVVTKNPATKDVIIDKLLSEDKSPFILTAILAKSFSNYLYIKGAKLNNLPIANIRENLGVNSWVFNKYEEVESKYTLNNLVKCTKALVRADSMLKNRSLGSNNILSQLMTQLHNVADK